MFTNVLLAVDGSGRSREMMNMLLRLPSLQQIKITLLHVIPMQATTEGLAEYRLAGERIIAHETTNLKLGTGNTCVTMLQEGDPKDVVCRVAEEVKPDFLVMGSRGLGRLQAILANSVSQYVFQIAAVPMLLIKDDVYIQTLRRVMVVVDSSPASQQCLDFAIAIFQGAQDTQIHLLRVTKKAEESDIVLEGAADRLRRLGIPHRTMQREGDEGKQICAAVADIGANLLLLASPERRPSIARGLPDLDRLLGSSVSDYVRVNASCAVLLTRSSE